MEEGTENPAAAQNVDLQQTGPEDTVVAADETSVLLEMVQQIRRADRDAPNSMHQVTAVLCLDPAVPVTRKAIYMMGSFVS
eukprot:SAG31_NODE_1209_length_9381_cov_2.526611_7_plen_81_part_00